MMIALGYCREIKLTKLYESKTWLNEKYILQKMGIVDIAKEAGCSHMTIQRALEKYGLKRKRNK